jgi:FkbM family methyltransferase
VLVAPNYHSQIGQDKWIVEEVFQGLRNGYFVDVGAYDGISLSNTYVLEKELGWTGLCVEPIPEAYRKLIANRSCPCVNACAYSSEGLVEFVLDGMFSAIRSHDLDESLIDLSSTEPQRVITVKATTLLKLLQRHRAPKTIHYLSLDVEGAEYEVLRTFDFSKYRFLAITVEHNDYWGRVEVERRRLIRELLIRNGYRHIRRQDWDDYYMFRR